MKIERAFSANVDNSLRDEHYSLPAEFNTCFIIHSKYFHVLYTLTSSKTLQNIRLFIGSFMI